MKVKKSLAFILSVALIGTCLSGVMTANSGGFFSCPEVSADIFVPYGLSVSMFGGAWIIPEGETITKDFLKQHISVTEIIGTYHDCESDQLYGQTTETNTSRSLSLDDCTVTLPDEIVDGVNKITITYCPPDLDESFAVSSTECIYVTRQDLGNPYAPNPYPDDTESPDDVDPDNYKPVTYGNVTFDVTDAISKPGETTYVDINIGENSGFCAVLLTLIFDDNVFSIKSISTTSDFTGKEYDLHYYVPNKNMIFMNKCITNMKNTDSSVIRVALKVNENAPEGDYTIGIASDYPDGQIAGHLPDNQIGNIGMTTLPGTVTVSKTLAPKTNVSSMSLGRVYATIDGEDTEKVGDTTGDGRINAMDSLKMIRYFTGIEEDINNADIDENGKLNVADLIQLKNYITLG